ncbi:hypothetical protein [uncultured Thiodictyon sp.]|uniref:hypothetical protein n=1 Tax=uncultured Thiodictyon sp. TaxID=1846217 RepID=UPI0025CE292B|nr:hypothetical protein [uncultured Thiodictyon sp.]
MMNTIRATLSPAGTLSFDDPVRITAPVRVLVTLLDEQPSPVRLTAAPVAADVPAASESSNTRMTDQARANVWNHLLALRQQAIEKGMPLLDWDQIHEEVRERRGGRRDD